MVHMQVYIYVCGSVYIYISTYEDIQGSKIDVEEWDEGVDWSRVGDIKGKEVDVNQSLGS